MTPEEQGMMIRASIALDTATQQLRDGSSEMNRLRKEKQLLEHDRDFWRTAAIIYLALTTLFKFGAWMGWWPA